jgi:hypothetical protein
MFYGYILTDGVSLNFVFSRLPRPTHYNLYAPDFSRHSIQGHFRIAGLDPGRRDIVTTAGGVGDGIYPTRQVSTAEYRSISGVTKRQQHLENLKNTTMITELDGNIVPFSTFESNLPTLKTTSPQVLQESIRVRLSTLNQLLDFYDIRQSRNRFKAFQGQQRAIATTTNIALNGGKKFRHDRPASKRNQKLRKNRKAKRRRLRQQRQQAIKDKYDLVVEQLVVVNRQIKLMDDALLNLARLNSLISVESVDLGILHANSSQAQRTWTETLRQQLTDQKIELQASYLAEVGGR